MTQIIAALTQDFVVLASDRKVTYYGGPLHGREAKPDACKLVSLCGVAGIAYTGCAELDGMPTNEWTGIQLADQSCTHPEHAAIILTDAATRVLGSNPVRFELTLIVAGWMPDIRRKEGLSASLWLITNAFGADGKRLPDPATACHRFRRTLKPNEVYASRLLDAVW